MTTQTDVKIQPTIAMPDLIVEEETQSAVSNAVSVIDDNGTANGALVAVMSQLTPIEINPKFQKPLFTVRLTAADVEVIKRTEAALNFDDVMSIMAFGEASSSDLTAKLKVLHRDYGAVRNLGGAGDLLLKLTEGVTIIDELKTRAGQLTTTDDTLRRPEPHKTLWQRAKEGVQKIEVLGIGKAIATVELDHKRNARLEEIFNDLEADIKTQRRTELGSLATLGISAKAVDANIRAQTLCVIAGQRRYASAVAEYEIAKVDQEVLGNPAEIMKLLQRRKRIDAFAITLLETEAWIVELALLTTPRIQGMQDVVEGGIRILTGSLQRDLPRLIEAALDCAILFGTQDKQQRAADMGEMSKRISAQAGSLHRDVAIAGKKAEVAVVSQIETLGNMADFMIETQRIVREMDEQNKASLEQGQKDLADIAEKMQGSIRAQL